MAQEEESLLRTPPGLPSLGPASGDDGAGRTDEFRRQILGDLEVHMQSKMEDILRQGRQMLQKETSQWKEKFGEATKELTECRQRQQELEAENMKLKQALTGVAMRLSMYGPMYTGARETPADIMSPLQPWMPADGLSHATAHSPLPQASAGTGRAETTPKLAPVPDFPVPPDPASAELPAQAEPIKLAQHIDAAQSTQKVTVSLSASLGTSPGGGTIPPPTSPPPSNGSSATTFSFALRKADGASLGLNISHNDSESFLLVEGVQEGGAVEAWNKQCAAGAAEKAVLRGDHVVGVNDIAYDPKRMLEECKEKQLLRLTIRRPEPVPRKTLRAEASVFVPRGSASPEPAASELPPTAETSEAPPVALRV